jgi:hypothetical protein
MIYKLLEDKTTIPTDDLLGPDWSIESRRVGNDYIGPYRVSTVFLVLDHRYTLDGPPLLFETMVFKDEDLGNELLCERCSTWKEAEIQHKQILADTKLKWEIEQL